MKQKITPFLWFDTEAEEAMNFYCSVFQDASPGEIRRYGKALPELEGKVMSVTFTLHGLEFTALNGGPKFKFNEAASLFVDCEDQKEVDEYWYKLRSDGGREGQCGWVQDKFGLWWQIVPKQLNELLANPDPEKSKRVMQAMLQMKKLKVDELEEAFNSEPEPQSEDSKWRYETVVYSP